MKKFKRVMALLLVFAMLLAAMRQQKGGSSAGRKGRNNDRKQKKSQKQKIPLRLHRVQIRYPWIPMEQQTPAIRVASCMFETLVRLDDEGNVALPLQNLGDRG